jgi:hypothetical protein
VALYATLANTLWAGNVPALAGADAAALAKASKHPLRPGNGVAVIATDGAQVVRNPLVTFLIAFTPIKSFINNLDANSNSRFSHYFSTFILLHRPAFRMVWRALSDARRMFRIGKDFRIAREVLSSLVRHGTVSSSYARRPPTCTLFPGAFYSMKKRSSKALLQP